MARILLAEDELSMRHFLTSALEKAGHSVTPCEDGLAAFAQLKSSPEFFDLLLADIIMPGMDGIELSQKATRLNPAIKVLFITGFAGMATRSSGEAGQEHARVLSKPFHLNQLVQQIDDLLA